MRLINLTTASIFGMDEAIQPAKLFAMAFVATATLLYDFDAGANQSIPKAKFAAGVALPESEIRVRIRKR